MALSLSEFRTSRTYTDNLPILLPRARLETVNAVYVFSEWETSKVTVTSLSWLQLSRKKILEAQQLFERFDKIPNSVRLLL